MKALELAEALSSPSYEILTFLAQYPHRLPELLQLGILNIVKAPSFIKMLVLIAFFSDCPEKGRGLVTCRSEFDAFKKVVKRRYPDPPLDTEEEEMGSMLRIVSQELDKQIQKNNAEIALLEENLEKQKALIASLRNNNA